MFGLTLLTLLSGCADKGCCYVECLADETWTTSDVSEGTCQDDAANQCWDIAGQDPVSVTWVAGCTDCAAECAPEGWGG